MASCSFSFQSGIPSTRGLLHRKEFFRFYRKNFLVCNASGEYLDENLPIRAKDSLANNKAELKSLSTNEVSSRNSSDSTKTFQKTLNRGSKKILIPRLINNKKIMSNAELPPGSDSRKTLGVDYGDRRTGIAVTYKGFSPRILKVSDRQRRQLVLVIVEAAQSEGADEIILGMPRSWDFVATAQTEKVLNFGTFLAQEAARRGIRVYLFDEFKTSKNAMALMVNLGQNKRTRMEKLDAFSAVVILGDYFEVYGQGAIILPPKETYLQEALLEKFKNYVKDI